jgi:hypothetical protein
MQTKIAFTTIAILTTAIFSATLAMTVQSANAICSESGGCAIAATTNGIPFASANNLPHNTSAVTVTIPHHPTHSHTGAATNKGLASTGIRACPSGIGVVKNGNTICAA